MIIIHVMVLAVLVLNTQNVDDGMTTIHNSLAAFDLPQKTKPNILIECLQFYMAANGITDAVKQQAVSMSCY